MAKYKNPSDYWWINEIGQVVVTCKNVETGTVFDKTFFSPHFAEQFIKKCRYSKKICIL